MMCFRPELNRSLNCEIFPVGFYTFDGKSFFPFNACRNCKREENTGKDVFQFVEMLKDKGAKVVFTKEGEEMIKKLIKK